MSTLVLTLVGPFDSWLCCPTVGSCKLLILKVLTEMVWNLQFSKWEGYL